MKSLKKNRCCFKFLSGIFLHVSNELVFVLLTKDILRLHYNGINEEIKLQKGLEKRSGFHWKKSRCSRVDYIARGPFFTLICLNSDLSQISH